MSDESQEQIAFCPLLSAGQGYRECLKEQCAWWLAYVTVENAGSYGEMCAINRLAIMLTRRVGCIL